ncbi:hypothetical protein ACF0H5_014246 [Mactra antiquata]
MKETTVRSMLLAVVHASCKIASSRMDSNATNENSTASPNCTSAVHPYLTVIEQIRYASILSITIGIPGNILAFAVWIRPRMRNSSGVYMAVLAVTQTLVLACRLAYDSNFWWNSELLQNQIMCPLFPVVFYALQYLDTLLYIAFTVERYISVCHPLKRTILCTVERSIRVSICLTFVALVTASMQAYFWTYDEENGCDIRKEVVSGDTYYFWNIWSISTDFLFFFLVPFAVLALNILVIRAVKQSRKRFSGVDSQRINNNEKLVNNTRPLLYVSFYFIILTLPVSIVYVTVTLFKTGSYECVIQENDTIWNRYFIYHLVRQCVETVSLLHYALNFYIYMVLGETFRNEFNMMMCGTFSSRKYSTHSK